MLKQKLNMYDLMLLRVSIIVNILTYLQKLVSVSLLWSSMGKDDWESEHLSHVLD